MLSFLFLSFSSPFASFVNALLWLERGRALLRWIVACIPPRLLHFDTRSSRVGFVVDKVAVGQVLSRYFRFSFHRLLHTQHLGPQLAYVSSGLRLARIVFAPEPRHCQVWTCVQADRLLLLR
jgi:hypothetical protein